MVKDTTLVAFDFMHLRPLNSHASFSSHRFHHFLWFVSHCKAPGEKGGGAHVPEGDWRNWTSLGNKFGGALGLYVGVSFIKSKPVGHFRQN